MSKVRPTSKPAEKAIEKAEAKPALPKPLPRVEDGTLYVSEGVTVDLKRYKFADVYQPAVAVTQVLFYENFLGRGGIQPVDVADVGVGRDLVALAKAYWQGG